VATILRRIVHRHVPPKLEHGLTDPGQRRV